VRGQAVQVNHRSGGECVPLVRAGTEVAGRRNLAAAQHLLLGGEMILELDEQSAGALPAAPG